MVERWGITGAKDKYRVGNLPKVLAKARACVCVCVCVFGGGLMSMDIHAHGGYAWA
jgi:hypothetical protein